MNSTGRNFTDPFPSSITSASQDANYYAFFDKPSPENLAANRIGTLTPQQQAALQTNISYRKTTNAIIIGTLIAAAFFLGFLFWKIDSLDGTLSTTAQLINAGVILVVFGIFAVYLTGDWFVYFMGDDIEDRVVESATGTMEWDGKRYRMRMDDRSLRSLSHGTILPPGAYRFYYLPHTRLVVMAEELETSPAQHASLLLRTLTGAIRFSLDEVKSNRDGVLSKHQENRLVWTAAFTFLIGLSGAAVFVVLLPRIFQALSATGLVIAVMIGAVLLLRLGWDTLRIMSDVWHGDISITEGPVSKKTRRSRYSHSYYYVCGAHQFRVSKTAYAALIEGKTYRIFYVPRSRRLVSIEPL